MLSQHPVQRQVDNNRHFIQLKVGKQWDPHFDGQNDHMSATRQTSFTGYLIYAVHSDELGWSIK